VPFLKFSRDRRGYEHFSLVESVSGRRGKARERVLYWFRTPPNVKVGREPFDDHVMHALEAQYPSMRFDWAALRNTPIPSVEPEYWRERRRADRAARRAQDEEEEATATATGDRSIPEQPVADSPDLDVAGPAISDAPSAAASDSAVGIAPGVTNEPGAGDSATQQQRHRRRRRGQRQRGPIVGRGGREDV
jgi:hypothetical protein